MFLKRLCGLVLVVVASCLLCMGASFLIRGSLEPVTVGTAHLAGLIVGVVTLKLVQGAEVSYGTVLAATGTRAAGVCLAGGLLYLVIPNLTVDVYVLSIAASYFAVLVYETWLLSVQLKQQYPVEKRNSAEGAPSVENPAPNVG